MKVLIVEDEKELASSICEYLQGENFNCEAACDYDLALAKLLSTAGQSERLAELARSARSVIDLTKD